MEPSVYHSEAPEKSRVTFADNSRRWCIIKFLCKHAWFRSANRVLRAKEKKIKKLPHFQGKIRDPNNSNRVKSNICVFTDS